MTSRAEPAPMRTEAEWREANNIGPDDRVQLVGEWWWVGDVEGTGVPEYMIWAGGRDIYDDACAIAKEKFGMTPIAFPLSAFFVSAGSSDD